MLSCYKTEILTHFGDQFVQASICSWPNFTPVRLMLHRQCPHIGDKQRKCHKKCMVFQVLAKIFPLIYTLKHVSPKTQFWAKISIFTFLPTPVLECYLSEIFLLTPALECIFGDTWSSDIFAGTTLPCQTGGEGGIGEGGGVRGGVIG